MLTTFAVAINVGVLVLIPLVIFSLMRGSPPPNFGPLSKYYQAEKYLNVVGNLFVLSICAMALGKLGLHFVVIDMSAAPSLEFWTSIPLLTLLVIYLALWVRAVFKVSRLRRNSA